MNTTAYDWKTPFMKVSADVAGKEFERIDKKRGLTAEAVVDESRPEDAPLHDAFEWDDAVAGEEWRKQQARVMIGNLVIQVEELPESPQVRAYVMIDKTASVYESTKVILQLEDKKQALMRIAMRELQSFQRKYSDLQEFARLFAEIDRLSGAA